MTFGETRSDRQPSCRSTVDFEAQTCAPDLTLHESVWERLTKSPRAESQAEGSIVERVCFDADDFPEAERAAAYQHLIASTARMTPLASPIRLRAAYYSLGSGARLCLYDNIPYRFERSRAKVAFDRFNWIAIQHLYRGDAVGTFDGAPSEMPEGSIYGIDFGRPSTIVEHRPVRLVLLGLERRAATAVCPVLENIHGSVLDREQAHPYLRELYALVPRLDELRVRDAPDAVASLLSALGRCFSTGEAQSTDDRLAARRRLVMAHMERGLADPSLSPESIARSLGLSRSALFRIFEPDGGVQKALLDLRLRRVIVLLSLPGPRPPLAQIAAACGFSSPEQFSRHFRRRFGVSPSRYRSPVAPR